MSAIAASEGSTALAGLDRGLCDDGVVEPCSVFMLRHGHVATGGRLCGWYDVELSARGLAQVLDVRERLADLVRPHALYCSSLLRSRQTGVLLQDALGRPMIVDRSWREISCGDLDGWRIDDVERRYPDVWNGNLAQTDETFAWPGGESYAAFRARVVGALDAVARAHPGGAVLIVTHAGVVTQAVGAIQGYTAAAWARYRPDPVHVTQLRWGDGVRELVAFNRLP